MGLLFFFLEDDRYESGKKERTIGWGVWSRVALLLTRGGATSIYTVGRTERKKTTKERERERKKKKEKTTSRERDIHTLTLSAFSFCFSNITSTRKHTRARLPLPPKPKPKKQVTSPLSTRI